MMQITYQKRNGNIIYKLRKTMIPYEIGETTSMGWKVLNIEYEYNNKFYPLKEYNMLISKNVDRYIKKQQIKELCIKETKTLLYIIIGLYIINLINILLG